MQRLMVYHEASVICARGVDDKLGRDLPTMQKLLYILLLKIGYTEEFEVKEKKCDCTIVNRL